MKDDANPDKTPAFDAANDLSDSEVHADLAGETAELTERRRRAAEGSIDSGALTDPIEDDPDVGPIVRRILRETSAAVIREGGGAMYMGACHVIWARAQDQLLRDHGITWYSPAEMNPCTLYD